MIYEIDLSFNDIKLKAHSILFYVYLIEFNL